MLAPKNSPSIARTVCLTLPMIAMAISGCSRDDLAPDCSLPDCSIPGEAEYELGCEMMPAGAVGATYTFDPKAGMSVNLTNWTANMLPPGLEIDPNTGVISGTPTEADAMSGIVLNASDPVTGDEYSFPCGELVINEPLNAVPEGDEPACLPPTASYDDIVAFLKGGDGTEITCEPLVVNDEKPTCPLGDGNGRPPPGISFDASSCSHSGTISGDRRGTWVWMVEVRQSEYTTVVPFCAENDVPTFHTITHQVDGNDVSDLEPARYAYDPQLDLMFGGGTHTWAIDDPSCPGPDCNTYGFRFNVFCSPFDIDDPWTITLDPWMGTDTGLVHEMFASGPAPDPEFDYRPWVTSFEMSYCTSATAGFCDDDDVDQFEQNAQTKYHFDVIGYPTL